MIIFLQGIMLKRESDEKEGVLSTLKIVELEEKKTMVIQQAQHF